MLRSLTVIGNGTIGQIIHDVLLVELFDGEYYRDLEMWVRGHTRSLKVVPLESLRMVSYSPSIVSMAVSLAIPEIFSVKEWPELEIWVWGRSKSLKMAQFDRSCMTDAIRKLGCGFLFAFYSNYGCICRCL